MGGTTSAWRRRKAGPWAEAVWAAGPHDRGMTTVPEELPGRAGLLAALGGGFTAASLLLHTPLRAPLTAVLAPLGRTALGAGILAAQAVLSPLWLRRFRSGPGRCGPRPDDATIAGRETGGGRSLMGWLRDRLARLGAPR